MDAAYLKAAVPEPFTILGKRLQPYCVGHDLLFQRFHIGFSHSTKTLPSYEDLILGSLICSRPATGAMRFFESRHAALKVKLWGWRCGSFDAVDKIELFQKYVNDHSELPDFEVVDNDNYPETGTPTIQAVKVSLMANLGMSESEALNTPYSLAFWNHYAWAEAKGAIRIVDDEYRARLAEAKLHLDRVEEIRKKVMASLGLKEAAPC